MTFQICVNAVFLLTLVLDWWALGFFSSYSKHPRVFAETVAQILNLLFFYYVVIHEWFASSVE
jgi:succinate dehydrogenase hydrophobic anchor subunit